MPKAPLVPVLAKNGFLCFGGLGSLELPLCALGALGPAVCGAWALCIACGPTKGGTTINFRMNSLRVARSKGKLPALGQAKGLG